MCLGKNNLLGSAEDWTYTKLQECNELMTNILYATIYMSPMLTRNSQKQN